MFSGAYQYQPHDCDVDEVHCASQLKKVFQNIELNFAIISFCNLTIADYINAHIINSVVLLAKYFIFKCKQANGKKTTP